jgi:hypothetical protein
MANIDSSPILVTLMMEALSSSETSILAKEPHGVTSQKMAFFKLTLNLDINSIIKFITYNSAQFLISFAYEDKYIEESVHTEFLGLQIDSHLNWKTHVDQLVPKLSGACYAVRSLSHFSNINILKLIYFAYFHS